MFGGGSRYGSVEPKVKYRVIPNHTRGSIINIFQLGHDKAMCNAVLGIKRTDRQTDRQADKQADRQTDKQAGRQTDR